MPGPMRGRSTERAKDFKGSMLSLLRYLGAYKIALVMVAIFAIASTIFNVVGPRILGDATTELYSGLTAKLMGTGTIDFHRIGLMLLFLMGLYLISSLCSWIQAWLMTGMSQKMARRLRDDISKKINRMPLSYFESNLTGDVLSRITNDVDTLSMSLSSTVTQLITSICTIIGILILMLTISPLMTLITLIILPVSIIIVVIIVRHSQKYFMAQQRYLGLIDGQVEESFSGHDVIKAFNREETERKAFDKTNKILFESAWKSQFLSGLMMPIMTFVSNLGYVAVAISGAMLAAAGTIAIGDIVAFIQYVQRFTQPITQLANVSNMLQSMAAAAERIFEFLNEEEEDQTEKEPMPASEGDVCFDHVRFGYQPNKTIIHDFDCHVKPGQMVAIVGPTGAGKTTMVKLLMRFYDVNGGAVRVDNCDVRDYDRSSVRANFGMVLQDTWLFQGSIMENIRYGRLDATDDEVIAAAKAARADTFIRQLPGGYNMEINEEASNVSAGQKQLLTIARTLLADNPILILDEATSSVDTRTEQLIQDAMAELMKGRTSFVIAHRLSTIRDADLILVMRDGDIVEQGTHKDLLAQNGFYAQLYNSQFEEVG